MDLGHEIGQQIRAAIKTKLQDLGSYVDDELPEYIMVMLANKRTTTQMNEDLMLFLGENTSKFTDWLFNLIEKLKDVASAAENVVEKAVIEQAKEEIPDPKPALLKTSKSDPKGTSTSKPVSVPTRSPKSPPREAKTSKKTPSSHVERPKLSSTIVRSESKGQRKQRVSDGDGDERPALPSVVQVQEKRPRPTLPASKQATGSLLRKAVTEAHRSVSKHVPPSNLTYDPTAATTLMRIQSFEEKQQQKELLLRQHRELQQQLEREELENANIKDGNNEEAVMEEPVLRNPELSADSGIQSEPVIELCVSEAEALELCSTDSMEKDTRIVALADSPTANQEEETRKRRKKRAVKARVRLDSPKFIVTLDGVDSELEDKYLKGSKRSKRLKKDEFDDFVEVDTSTIPVQKVQEDKSMPQEYAAPSVEQVMIHLDTSASDEEEVTDQSQVKPRSQERCRFWPVCLNGDNCPYFHPTFPCRTFPNCPYGKSCMFVHPSCKFDGRCTNSMCPYLHKLKSKPPVQPAAGPQSSAADSPVSKSNATLPTLEELTLCKYFPACTRLKCPFHHPAPPPKICRYGNLCTRLDCVFSHPPKKADLKWSASPKHISERSFALPDQNVTNMPVVS